MIPVTIFYIIRFDSNENPFITWLESEDYLLNFTNIIESGKVETFVGSNIHIKSCAHNWS
jgi:hypothetical protein